MCEVRQQKKFTLKFLNAFMYMYINIHVEYSYKDERKKLIDEPNTWEKGRCFSLFSHLTHFFTHLLQ